MTGRPAAKAKDPDTRRKAQTKAERPGRINDPEATRANILDVALHEFADKGLAGPGSTRSPNGPGPASG